MLNRYFNADGNIDFLYANISVKNIHFALISLDHILYRTDFDIGIYHDEHTYYFFHIQSLLTACGNISNVFYNHGRFGGKEATKRSQRLRGIFNIKKAQYPLIFQKEARNTNEHFDERYEEFRGCVGDYNLLDENTTPHMREVIINKPHLRTYDKENGVYHTYNHKLEPISYNLYQLHEELHRMLVAIETNPVFESAWVDTMPNEELI